MNDGSLAPLDAASSSSADRCAALILDAFGDYNARFSDVTRRARRRFEQCDWTGARRDAVERIELYERCIDETLARLEQRLDDRLRSRALWAGSRAAYARLVEPLIDRELYKTFFNSLTRRCFRTHGVAPDLEFVALEIEPTDGLTHPVARHSYVLADDATAVFRRALLDYPFHVNYAHPHQCAQRLAETLGERFSAWGERPLLALELLDTVFYRERRAYLVGRVLGERQWSPLVLALMNDADGLRVDAAITESDQLAVLFGYSRSYFHADLATVGDAVVFLRSLLPYKPTAEIYTVLGRAKQGKTERYRHFFRHLAARPDERFDYAAGEPGMVMQVFTLPSYRLVFKLIRDRFAYPKDMAREDVMEKYHLVFHHDRVGRLVDAQEFRHLRFPRRQFEPALLADLLEGCRQSVAEDGDDLIVRHCYVERRLKPLDRFVRHAPPEQARAALLDYGQAIKDLAASGIFPGDLLLKNFGVGRSGNVVFYDYDELALLADCQFRAIPPARHEDEEWQASPWYYVGPNDVFPEQFPRFLGVPAPLRQALTEAHGEIFDPAWWRSIQARLASGETPDIAPYPQACRLL